MSDELLCIAALEIEQGRFEADLGGGICKKRIAVPGQGKSGSTRTLVAKRHNAAVFFLAGRSKSDPESDFSDKEEVAAKMYAGFLQVADAVKLNELTTGGALLEICNEERTNQK